MATQETQTAGQSAAETKEVSFLEQAISATKQTSRDEAQDLLKTLTEQAMKGTVKWDKNLSVTINSAIAAIDDAMSSQLSAILHADKFKQLEGSWRGLHHLVKNSETGSSLKIRVMNISKRSSRAIWKRRWNSTRARFSKKSTKVNSVPQVVSPTLR